MFNATVFLEVTQILAIAITCILSTLSVMAMILMAVNDMFDKVEKVIFNCLWLFAMLIPSILVFNTLYMFAGFVYANTELTYNAVFIPTNIAICLFESGLLYLFSKILSIQTRYLNRTYTVSPKQHK